MSREAPKTIYASMWDFQRQGWTFPFPAAGQRPVSSPPTVGDQWSEINDSSAKGLPAKPVGPGCGLQLAPAKPQVVYANIEAEKRPRPVPLRRRRHKLDQARRQQLHGVAPVLFGNLIVDPKDGTRFSNPISSCCTAPTAGKTFNVVSGGAHGDFHDVWINPKNPNVVIAGDDGGLWRSETAAIAGSTR